MSNDRSELQAMTARAITVLLTLAVFSLALSVTASGLPRIHPLYLEEEHRSDYAVASIRDREGFLWIATDNGLKRYDGYNLRVFGHAPANPASVGSNSLKQLILHSDGTLWAAGSGLSQYNPRTETFRNFSISNKREVRALYEDDQGMLWLGGDGFGLLKFDPNKNAVVETFFEGTGQSRISEIVRHDASAKVWLASDAGLFLFDTQTYESVRFTLPLDFSAGVEAIHGMTEDNDKHLWIATHDGLYVLNPQTTSTRHYSADPHRPGALSTDTLWSVMKDSKGQIWVGTDKNGVHKYNSEKDEFEHFPASVNDKYRFPTGAVMHIQEDKEGSLWFSVGHYGVYRLSPHLQKFTSFQSSFDSTNSLSLNNVLTFHEDREGMIWIGTDGGGLDKFDPKTNDFVHYRHDPEDPESLSSNSVLAIAEDSEGIIWLGTWSGGLNRLDPRTGKFRRIERDPSKSSSRTLADNHVFKIEINDQDHLLLAVGRAGLQIYNPKNESFKSYSPLDENSPSNIRSDFIHDILRGPNGDYWIAGFRGIEIFTPETETFRSPDYWIVDPISDLHFDDEGFLWVATDKSLTRYNPFADSAEVFTASDGLSDEYVVSIEQDSLGALWIGTRSGLNRFDPRTKEVTVFSEHDGLAGSQFNRFSHLRTRDGTMYFGGPNGFSYFDPLHIPRNEHAPEVHIIATEINHKPQYPGSSPWLSEVIDYVETLILPSTQRSITFTLAATNLISPSKNLYRYRLLGLNDAWLTVDSSRRTVHYSNLQPGKYQFQVLASNNEGVWAGSAKELNLIILPAWWQTWWARGVYVMLFFAAMFGFSYWRLRSNKKRERQLEFLVNEQTYELKSANRSIVQLNSELEQRVAQRTRDLSIEIEERRESEAKANYIAYHDALTGLYNRAWLLKHMEGLLKESSGTGRDFALFFIGGDRFRKINDTYGHKHGDTLLVAAANRLLRVVPNGCHAVRLGSDEFTVVADSTESQAEATALAEAITAEFKEQFVIENVRMSLSVSVGFVIADNSYTEPSQVIRNANIAMRRAKDRGRGTCQMFDDVILQHTLDMAALEADLKVALQQDQFSVVYQPIMIVESGALSGFEVLIRWHHPERGMVPPDRFIAIAESMGLIFDIGLWVLKKACLQLQEWQTQFNPPLLPTIAVNLSPIQLDHADFLEKVDEIFRDTGIAKDKIKFEITESALMKHTETVDGLLDSLRQRGIELAIDDFGTGYSSLSYLDKLPVQILKIDRTFINALTDTKGNNGSAHEIVRATISLAHNLNMRVVAEGIETEEQLSALVAYGCDYGQGYLLARPLSPEDATEFFASAKVARLTGSPEHGHGT